MFEAIITEETKDKDGKFIKSNLTVKLNGESTFTKQAFKI